MTFDEIIAEIDSIQSYIADASARINGGEDLDLEGLDDRVETVCLAIEKLEPEEADQTEEPLKGLINSLGSLELVLKENYDFDDEDEE